jgi:phage N-6-adenine-methyltransferase
MGRLHEGKAATGRTTYDTPWWLLRDIELLFGPIDLDAAASWSHRVCPRFLGDIEAEWPRSRLAFMNPPYGGDILYFLQTASWQVVKGVVGCCVCLVPARTDTKWWNYATNAWGCTTRTFLLDGRIRFGGASHPAMFPSALIVYGNPLLQNWEEHARFRPTYRLAQKITKTACASPGA